MLLPRILDNRLGISTWESKTRVASSNSRVTRSNQRVTSSNLGVTSSNPRVTRSPGLAVPFAGCGIGGASSDVETMGWRDGAAG